MRGLVWACAGALAILGGCTCEGKLTPDAGMRDAAHAAAPQAPVTDLVRLVREADTAFQAGRLDEAIEKAEAALKLAPTHALALNVLGRASAARFAATRAPEDAARAEDAFTRAAQANPGFWPALQNLAELAEKQGELQAAAGYYEQVLAAQPDHPERARFEKVIASARAAKTDAGG